MLWGCLCGWAQGIVFITPSVLNTTAPEGEYAGSGWQYQGQWGSFLGTAISPYHFITAKHLNFLFQVGDVFQYRGQSYATIGYVEDPDSDLSIWQVDSPFPDWAPLYSGGTAVGQEAVLFGRGRERGEEVIVNQESKGWTWGDFQAVQRWGTNVIAGLSEDGLYLTATFDRGQSENEAHLSEGDSGGGLFLFHDGQWQLAGIHFAVDGPFNQFPADSGAFQATLFDMGGLYQKTIAGWTFLPDTELDQPSRFYSTNLAVRRDWIEAQIPEPGRTTLGFLLAILPSSVLGGYWRRRY